MPRAKVKDEDRQRARKACVPCKTSKIRCDANQPCANCTKKNRIESCQYVDAEQPARKVARKSYHQTSPQSTLSESSVDHRDRTPISSANAVQTYTPAPDGSHSHASANAPSPEVTYSRMLLNAKGEKIYIGRYSSLSVLEFLRQTVALQIGPSQFSEMPSRNVMLEIDVRTYNDVKIEDRDVEYQQGLIQCYFEVSSGLLYLYEEDEIYGILTKSMQREHSFALTSDERAALYVTMAIGAMSRGHEPYDLKFASHCFTKARGLAFEGDLCDPNINMVRIFVLLAFYMLGACRRNAAYMYLGVAAKAACAVGLHSKSRFPDLSATERDYRKRVWKSLYVLDTMTNTFLGRPGTLPLIEPEQLHQRNGAQGQDVHTSPLDSAYGACTHIALIMPTVSRIAELDSSFTENFLGKLGKWREFALPTNRKFTFGMSSLPAFEAAGEQIGNMHVACIYYYAVILVTRPFLLSHLTFKLRLRKMSGNDVSATNPPVDPRIGKLAQACLDASTYMAQLCEQVMNSNGLRDNMFLLKAFLFAAGLLLGYSIFVDGKASENEDAFRSSVAVLQKLSRLSPQCRLYAEILRDFRDASSKYHQLQQDQRRQNTTQYVKPILPMWTSQTTNHSDYPTPSIGTASTISRAETAQSSAPLNGGAYSQGADFMSSEGFNTNDAIEFGSTGIDLDGPANMPLVWDENFDWSLFSAFPDEANIGM